MKVASKSANLLHARAFSSLSLIDQGGFEMSLTDQGGFEISLIDQGGFEISFIDQGGFDMSEFVPCSIEGGVFELDLDRSRWFRNQLDRSRVVSKSA